MFEKLAGRRPGWIDGERYGQFAVAVPWLPEQQAILFEVRSERLDRQPGEVSFPGGQVEPGETPRAAAVRETCEELLIPDGTVEVLAPLDRLSHLGLSVIHPFLVRLHGYEDSYSTDEVKSVFTVPFSFFLDTPPRVYHNQVSVTNVDEQFPYELLGVQKYPWAVARHDVLFYQYDGKVIWGMTARIMRHLVDLYRQL